MSAPAVADPRYPVGKFETPSTVTEADRKKWITDIEGLPAKMREAARGLTPQQHDTPYREGGWTVRQLLHHVPDSHLN
ncbi:MAG TPA: DinB family protein, partial [Terriglobales bacterium]|nr:DinB family protein [Terriglobales bacterium]